MLKLNFARLRLNRMIHSRPIYNCSKLPLIKWRHGMSFFGGAHAVSNYLKLSTQRSVLLHFKFSAGAEGLRYIAERGQHWGGSHFYKRMIGQDSPLSNSPIFVGTSRYKTSASLERFLA